MKCQRCGHINEPDFAFCENCGVELQKNQPAQPAKKDADELHIPSIFEKPVAYTGRYSDTYKRPVRRTAKKTKKWIGLAASAVVLLFIFWAASQAGRQNADMPPVIQEYADAVRAKDSAKLLKILLSAKTMKEPNAESLSGFLKIMEIPGRLNESVRNLEVDLSHLKQDPGYVSNLPVKLLFLEKDGKQEYRVAVDTFDVDVKSTGATIDGNPTGSDGIFKNYLMGQYTLEFGDNRYPLVLDSTNPHLAEGVITPPQLEKEAPVQVATSEGAKTTQEGALEVKISTNAPNAKLRIDGADTELTVSGLPDGIVKMDAGKTLQLVELWKGGIGLSDVATIEKAGPLDLEVKYDTQEFRDLIFGRIKAMFTEDALMLTQKKTDGFTTMVDPALAAAVDNVQKIINSNQNYAGAYDRIEIDPDSFRLEKKESEASVHVLGHLTYVYQTYDDHKPPLNVDDLYRDNAIVAIDLVLDPASGQWMVKDWGKTSEALSDKPRTGIDLR